MILADWAFILYSVYVPLIIAIYLLELYVIFHHRKTFNSSFYKIFSVLAVVNIAACTFATFVFRMPLYPIVNHLYESLMLSVTYYLNCLSQFLGVLLAFNRFTSLYFPVLHDYFWRWAIFAGIGVCIIVSVPPVVHLLYFPASFFDMASIWFNMAVVTVTCNSLSSLLYGACLVRLCFFSTTRNRSAERNFFIVGFLSMIFSLPYMAGMASFPYFY
ncbi:hypothetical protein PENTCL1PPCAC_13982 [Pristionchus entomophagus]|uniref:Serpentine receptor class gamma n=1 Tax=Pristionchus entomophagus TaxID=358040 RepID=A0AAV5TA42_9BILA|nr:hypothetical protein PENTCL1PPCAC_13982 [Pristionchus entomophagus]